MCRPETSSRSSASTSSLVYRGRHPASCSRLPLTTQGYIVYARSPAGDGVSPMRCSRAAAPSATADGSSIRRMPLSSSTSSCSSHPSHPTVSSPSTFSRTAYSSALHRSSTWQNCQAGRDPATTSSRGDSKYLVSAVSVPPTRIAGRTTVTLSPGWARGARRASRSISSRSPTPVASAVARSSASSESGSSLSGSAP